MSTFVADIARWSLEVVYAFGYPGIFALAVLSSLNVPIPEPVVLGLAGFLVGQGQLSFFLVVGASAAGAVAAALVLYAVGLWFGMGRLRRLVEKVERFRVVSVADLDKAEKAFERHGGEAILIAHVLPVGGSVISIPAGISRMSLLPFVVYTALGSTLWNAAFVALGWFLGARWMQVQRYATTLEHVSLVVVGVVVVWFLWRRLKSAAG